MGNKFECKLACSPKSVFKIKRESEAVNLKEHIFSANSRAGLCVSLLTARPKWNPENTFQAPSQVTALATAWCLCASWMSLAVLNPPSWLSVVAFPRDPGSLQSLRLDTVASRGSHTNEVPQCLQRANAAQTGIINICDSWRNFFLFFLLSIPCGNTEWIISDDSKCLVGVFWSVSLSHVWSEGWGLWWYGAFGIYYCVENIPWDDRICSLLSGVDFVCVCVCALSVFSCW